MLNELKETPKPLDSHAAIAVTEPPKAVETVVEIAPNHSPDGHCGMCLYLRVENRAAALAFKHDACARGVPACLPFDSGRHVYAN